MKEVRKEELTQDRLKTLVRYDPGTGLVERIGGKISKSLGKIAASPNHRGHLQMSIDGRTYMVHRLVWMYVFGEFPSGMIDHIDGKKTNNSIKNLRLVSRSENMQNRWTANKNSKSGFLGVSYRPKLEKWEARIAVNRKCKCIGFYGSPEEAHSAYLEAKREVHPCGEIAKLGGQV